MKIIKKIKNIFSMEKTDSKNTKLTFYDLYRHFSGSKNWLQSELVNYADPHGFTSQFRRRIRIFYNDKWHKGKFKLWKKWNEKDSDRFFIVKTKSKRKMLVPKEKIYFKQKHKKWMPTPHNDYFEIYTIHLYIEGNIKIYENLYQKLKLRRK